MTNLLQGIFKLSMVIILILIFLFLVIDGAYTNTRTECVTENNITTCKTKMDKVIEKWWWEK